jgi:hypothetical protein
MARPFCYPPFNCSLLSYRVYSLKRHRVTNSRVPVRARRGTLSRQVPPKCYHSNAPPSYTPKRVIGVADTFHSASYQFRFLVHVCTHALARLRDNSVQCFVIIPYAVGTMAPCLMSICLMSLSGTLRGVVFFATARAATAPAACPIAMQEACTRSPEFASRSLDTLRPATIMLRLPFGTRARSGIVGTLPGFSGLGLTPLLV